MGSWRGLPKTFWWLWAGSLVNRLGACVFPFLALYLRETRGFAVENVGLVIALYGIGSTAAGPLGGALSDRIGRRATLLLATVAGPAAMLHMAGAQSVRHILVSMALLGLCSEL